MALITTEQHWSALMKDAFLRDLSWPCPIESLESTSRTPLALLGEICAKLPSRLGPTDLVIVEEALLYMAAGIPVVASRVGVNPDIVADGETGFCVSTTDEWVAALRRLIGDAAPRFVKTIRDVVRP